MKNLPQPLIEFLLSTGVESCFKADLFYVQLPSGVNIYATDGQMPITYDGQTYQPTQWGNWKRTRVVTALGLTNATMDFEVTADATILMPNWNIPLLEAVQLGLFDASFIRVYTSYMPDYGDTSLGVETKYLGQISSIRNVGRTLAEGEATPFTFTLNQNMPRQVLQPGCRWPLYSPGCTVNKANFTFTNSVGNGGNAVTIAPANPFAQPDGYFTQGVITFTSGRNTGLSMQVQSHTGGLLRVARSFLFPVAVGDQFKVAAGCDHTLPTCIQKFSNGYPNFGGTPYIPNYETAL